VAGYWIEATGPEIAGWLRRQHLRKTDYGNMP
jgi:hypothetical protein